MIGRFVEARAVLATVIALAMTLSVAAQTNQAAVRNASGATPRAADGKPDLSGMWSGGGGGGGARGESDEKGNYQEKFPSRRCGPTQVKCDDFSNQSYDGEFTGRMDPNRPIYKPEYWDRVQFLDMHTNQEDPVLVCQPLGVPRVGPPTRILQTANDVVFLYNADYRVIPTDGRPRDPERAAQDATFYGYSIGHWEGDTLVIESVGFNDLAWLEKGGYFHSENMRTIERLHREGNELRYQVTVEDPDVLLEPWVMNPRVVRLNTDPKAYIAEAQPCRDYNRENMVLQIRH